jgi:hypothetical protein
MLTSWINLTALFLLKLSWHEVSLRATQMSFIDTDILIVQNLINYLILCQNAF